jgi:alpha-ketoglutarate-dependent taurine dioxygenase
MELYLRPGEPLPDVGPLREWTAHHGVVVIRGAGPLDDDAFRALASRCGPVLEWDFGAVNELRARSGAKNYLYTDHAVPFHWDGAFVGRIPHYILFLCADAPPEDAGGETLFCDTRRLLANAPPETRARWAQVRITYSTERIAHYGGRFTSPLIAPHPVTGEETLRFAEPVVDLNPVHLEIEGIPGPDQRRLLAELSSRLRDPELCLAHRWCPGDLVIADNHALLHGRNAFRPGAARHLRRINIL